MIRRLLSSPSSNTPTMEHLPPSPPRVELIIKLGGSCLTEKKRHRTIATGRFDTAMDCIARIYHQKIPVILVHGAGSFGHYEASQYDITGGNATPFGMAVTHATVVELNRLVVDALIDRDVPAVGVSPLLVPGRTRNDLVATVLDRGHLPVLHGDTCYSADGDTAVLSGDALVSSLALWFEFVQRVVFMCDIPGVLTKQPDKGGDIIRRMTVNEVGGICCDGIEMSVMDKDVTGGISNKLCTIARTVADTKGRVTGFIVGVGTEAADIAVCGSVERWGQLHCTRIVYEGNMGIVKEVGSNKRRWKLTRR